MKKSHILYILSLAAILSVFALWYKTAFPKSESSEIKVCISGGVNNPGVYTMTFGDRTQDLINASGGTVENAYTEKINLAGFLSDGQHIIVPVINKEAEITEPININTADIEELTLLNGIGEKKAMDIIEYRNTNGNFISPEDITKVNGIGTHTYDNIKDYITVD